MEKSAGAESQFAWPFYMAGLLSFALLIWCAAQISSFISHPALNEPLLFLPAGVALAGILLGGLRWAPAIFIGIFGFEIGHHDSLFMPVLMAMSGLLSACLPAYLLKRFFNPIRLDTVLQTSAFILVAAMLAPMVDAIILVLGNYFVRSATTSEALSTLFSFWLSRSLAIMGFVPLALAASQCKGKQAWRKLVELSPVLLCVSLVCWVAFEHAGVASINAFPLLLFPLVMVASLRATLLGAGLSGMLIAVFALTGLGQPVLDPEKLLYVGMLCFVLMATGLLLASQSEQNRQTADELEAQALRFSRVLDAMPTFVYLKDKVGRYLFANAGFAQLLDASPEQLQGKTDAELSRGLGEMVHSCEKGVVEHRTAITHESAFRHYDEELSLLFQHFPLFDAFGRLYGVGASVTDVTQRREEAELLRESTDKFRALVELSIVGIYCVQDSELVYVNPRLAEIFGYTQAEMTGKYLQEVILPDDLPQVRENLRLRFSGELDSMRYSFRGVRKNGEIIQVEVHSRITVFNGRPAVLGTLVDNTEQLRAAADLQLAAKVFESATEGIVITDTRSRIVTVNRAFTALTGYEATEVIGRAVPIFEDAMSHDLFSDMMEAMMVVGQWQGEFLAKKKSGDSIPVTLSVSMAKNERGKVTHYVAIFTDITSRKKLEKERLESENKFRALVELSLAGIYVVQDGIITYANPRLAEMSGYSQEELTGMHVRDFTAPEDLPILIENHRKRLSGEVDSIRYTYRALHRNGSRIEVEAHGRLFMYESKPAIIGILMDISDRVAAERQLRLAAKVFENASEGVLITDESARIIAVNAAFTRITGYAEAEALGKYSRMFHSRGEGDELNQEMITAVHKNGHWAGEMIDRRKNGEAYPAWLSISAVRDEGGAITNYVGVFTDFTSRKEAEDRLYFLANHDALTMLPNRSALNESLAHSIEQAKLHSERLAVLFIDLDRFKNVNDTLGHHAGDKLLQSVAMRLRGCLSPGDTIARLGGDEFTVVLETMSSDQYAGEVADNILQALTKPIIIDHQEIYVTCSIGISLFPNDGADSTTLLKNADVAMYRAKELGKNNFQFFASDMNAMAFERLLLENSLRHALERNEFELHFQPQVDTHTCKVKGMEALLRWRHRELGIVSPARFVPLAEESGLIVPIGEWVIEQACTLGRQWLDMGLEFDHVAINLSPRQFAQANLPQVVGRALRISGLPPHKLEIEVTESMIMRNPDAAIGMMNELKQMGVMLSIDDFGTGYSSLSNLKRFPIHNLKIDRSFIEGVPDDEDDCAITEAIIALAKKLKLKLIAEGVENQSQLNFLRERGCELVQGFMFSRPVPAEEMATLLSRTTQTATF